MYEWRFRITPGIIPQPLLERAYFAGWGRVPQPSHTTIQGDELLVRANNVGSGTIHVSMVHSPLGVVLESTESLLSRQEPYLLMKELTRGALGRLYRRLFDWQMLGFLQSKSLCEQIGSLAKRFSHLVIESSFTPELERKFVSMLEEIFQLVLTASREFTEQSLAWRMRNNEKLPLLFGIGINNQRLETLYEFDIYTRFLQEAFHAVLPMPSWRELETKPGRYNWEQLEKRLITPSRFGFQIILGPLLSFDADTIPDWILPHLSEDGYFETRASRFVNALAERYGHLVHSWILANRFVDQSLTDVPPSRSLALIRTLAQQLRSRGIEEPILVGIGQPWGEYALQRIPDWEQVQMAETLMGCREIDTFLLEIDFGSGRHLTLPRDPMSIGSMVDQWSFLGKKVYVSLSIPSAGNAASAASELLPELQWSEEKQRAWTEMLLLTLLGKRMVRGIFWSHLQDPITPMEDPTFSHRGLIDDQRVLKSAFKHFSAARKSLLK